MEATKKPWFSKTLIINFIVAACAIVGFSLDSIGITETVMVTALNFINIILRMVTKDKIGLSA
jgi:hypothetical protein